MLPILVLGALASMMPQASVGLLLVLSVVGVLILVIDGVPRSEDFGAGVGDIADEVDGDDEGVDLADIPHSGSFVTDAIGEQGGRK